MIRDIQLPRFLSYVVFLSLSLLVVNCAARQKEVRAYIEDNPHWKILENCGYEGCLPKVDFLTSKDIIIRIEFDNDCKKQYFVVRILFDSLSDQFIFRPSNAIAMLKDGAMVKSKGFTCAHTIMDLDYFHNNPPLQTTSIKKIDCFLLFFDHPAPNADDEVTMDMRNALFLNGKQVDIPLIYFRKNIGKQL